LASSDRVKHFVYHATHLALASWLEDLQVRWSISSKLVDFSLVVEPRARSYWWVLALPSNNVL